MQYCIDISISDVCAGYWTTSSLSSLENSLWLSSGSLYKVTGLVFNLTYFCYCLWWHLMFLYMVYMVKILPHKKLKPYDLAIL